MPRLHKLLTLALIAYLALFLLLFVCTSDRDFSAAENRLLQKVPRLSLEELLSGQFNAAMERYLADQFPGRDQWIGVKTTAELLLRKKDNNGVYFGRDRYLIPKPDEPDPALLAANIGAINRFAAGLPTPAALLLVPASTQILKDKLPPFAEPFQLDRARQAVVESLAPPVQLIDVYETLYEHRNEYIFYKTDHHWTTLGAYYAYREAGTALGYHPLGRQCFRIEAASNCFYGTLSAKSGSFFTRPDSILLFRGKQEPPLHVSYVHEKKDKKSLYVEERLQERDQYAVFLDGNHALVRIAVLHGTGQKQKILVIKDSYANCLVPFLVNHFAEIHLIDLRYFNLELLPYLAEHNFDRILLLYSITTISGDSTLRKLEPMPAAIL